jgi:hypothetical protein
MCLADTADERHGIKASIPFLPPVTPPFPLKASVPFLLNLNTCLADTADERHGIALVIIAVAAERRPTSRDCARIEKPCSKKKQNFFV